jgi:hypothetical protein
MKASICNGFHGIGLMDYAYLALNVYHGKGDEKYLGFRPMVEHGLSELESDMGRYEGWFQLQFPELKMSSDFGFHAEFYVKVYRGKIQHLMLSFRGTDNTYDDGEDVATWWNTVLPGSDHTQKVPHYWHYAHVFIMKCQHVIKILDQKNLLAKWVGHHVTGHSLGGALANLVSAKAAICQPAGMKARLPITPSVISFNAPGVGAMNGIDKSAFNEGMVISMRAEYDMVSALGEPYGYVINNAVPEGHEAAGKAFLIEDGLKQSSVALKLCDSMLPCSALARADQAAQAKSVFKQHGMGHFMGLIAHQPSALALSFEQLRSWAKSHGGMNHNLNAAPMFGQAQVAQAA